VVGSYQVDGTYEISSGLFRPDQVRFSGTAIVAIGTETRTFTRSVQGGEGWDDRFERFGDVDVLFIPGYFQVLQVDWIK
jgi:hypothetical protein